LKRMAHIELSNIDKKTVEGEAPVRLCNYVDVYKNENITADLDFMIASASFEQIDRLTLNRGDVIITKDSETPDDIGVPALVADCLEDVVCGYHLALLKMRSGVASGSYVARTMQSNYLRAQFATGAVGMTRFGLGKYEIENAILPNPPIAEQACIANFLNQETAKIDTLVAEQRRLVELLKEKRQSVISNAVTKGLNPDAPMKDSGIEWLGNVPEHWELFPLKRDLQFLTSGSRGWAENYSDDGDLFIRIGNLTRESIGLDLSDVQRVTVPSGAEGARTNVRAGDVLFSITAFLGSVAVVPENIEVAYVSQHVALARLAQKRLSPKWVAYVTLSTIGKTYLENRGYGGTKIQLSLDDVANLLMTAPPIDEQAAITNFLEAQTSRFDDLIAEASRAIDLLQERRTALISAAVTGKIDVRGMAKEQTA